MVVLLQYKQRIGTYRMRELSGSVIAMNSWCSGNCQVGEIDVTVLHARASTELVYVYSLEVKQNA